VCKAGTVTRSAEFGGITPLMKPRRRVDCFGETSLRRWMTGEARMGFDPNESAR
jgi:hypothetical protein